MPTKKSMKIVKNVKYLTYLVSHKKTIDPGKVSFLFRFSFYNIMFLIIEFERNLLLRENHENVSNAFKTLLLNM